MKEGEEHNMRPLGYISYDGGDTWFQQWMDEQGNLIERQAVGYISYAGKDGPGLCQTENS